MIARNLMSNSLTTFFQLLGLDVQEIRDGKFILFFKPLVQSLKRKAVISFLGQAEEKRTVVEKIRKLTTINGQPMIHNASNILLVIEFAYKSLKDIQ